MQWQKTDVFIINDNVASIARDNPDHHIKGGGFTRAVWTQQANDFAGVHGQTDIFHDAAAFIGFGEVLCS
ncbi:hypothetical protein D3C76_1507820 [compost metagenome]